MGTISSPPSAAAFHTDPMLGVAVATWETPGKISLRFNVSNPPRKSFIPKLLCENIKYFLVNWCQIFCYIQPKTRLTIHSSARQTQRCVFSHGSLPFLLLKHNQIAPPSSDNKFKAKSHQPKRNISINSYKME